MLCPLIQAYEYIHVRSYVRFLARCAQIGEAGLNNTRLTSYVGSAVISEKYVDLVLLCYSENWTRTDDKSFLHTNSR